jgi:hypothetical protein
VTAPSTTATSGPIARLSGLLANDWAVAEVTSVTTLLDRFVGDHSAATLERAAEVPQAAEAASGLLNLERGRDVAVIRAVPRWSPDSPGPIEAVGRIRDRLVPEAIAGQDAEVLVGGLSAQIVDITAESERKLPVVVGLVVGLSYLLLAVVFRSLVLPAKAIVLNALGIAAAYGLLVVVFQEGAGARLFDFDPTGSTQVYLPLLTFAVLFGLSMDYEVFLLSRIKEEWERTGDNRVAVAAGLSGPPGDHLGGGDHGRGLRRLRPGPADGGQGARLLAGRRRPDRRHDRPHRPGAGGDAAHGRRNWWFPAWLDRILPRVDLSEGRRRGGLRRGAGAADSPCSSRATAGRQGLTLRSARAPSRRCHSPRRAGPARAHPRSGGDRPGRSIGHALQATDGLPGGAPRRRPARGRGWPTPTGPCPGCPSTESMDAVAVVERVRRAVVTVVNERAEPGPFVEDRPRKVSRGTRFIVDDQGHVVTNEHVVRNGDRFRGHPRRG